MVPATDRSRTHATGHALALIGLAFGPLVVSPGCAKLQSRQATPTSAVLGVERPENNYSSYHTGRSLNPAASHGLDPNAPPVPQLAGVDPLPPGAMIAADPAPPPAAAEVTPASIPASEAGSTRLISASRGVPDAARLLAAGGRANPPAAAPAAPETATATVAPTLDPIRVIAESRAAIEQMVSYQASLHRQERVGSNLLPAEDLVLSVRRQPRAVRLSWPAGPNQGREAIYRADAADGLMNVHMAKGSIVPRMNLAPDSPLVMRNSRHPITEAGFEPILADLERATQTPGSTLTCTGMVTPAPLDRPHIGIARTNPQGEVATVYFDPETHVPALVEVKTATGDMLEHYVFRDVQINPTELAAADAFDPDQRWGTPKGLFGRVARGGGPDEPTPPR